MMDANQATTTFEVGQLVYEFEVQITDVVDYGSTLEGAVSGQELPPPGVRLDVAFEGTLRGALAGRLGAVDYVYVRPDGRIELHIFGTITSADEARIAFFGTGLASPNQDGTLRLFEYVDLHTNFGQYAWVNQLALRAEGFVELAEGTVSVRSYVA